MSRPDICGKTFECGVEVEIVTEERTIGHVNMSRPLMAMLRVGRTPDMPASELIEFLEARMESIRRALEHQEECNQEIAIKRVAGTLAWTIE